MPVFPGPHPAPFSINIHRQQLANIHWQQFPPNMFVSHNRHTHKSFAQIDTIQNFTGFQGRKTGIHANR